MSKKVYFTKLGEVSAAVFFLALLLGASPLRLALALVLSFLILGVPVALTNGCEDK